MCDNVMRLKAIKKVEILVIEPAPNYPYSASMHPGYFYTIKSKYIEEVYDEII